MYGILYSIFEARVPEFAAVYTSTIAHVYTVGEPPCPIHKTQASNRPNTSSPKYNDDITLLI
jgi:hypothetical protein